MRDDEFETPDDEQETSPSGQPIYRDEYVERDFEPAFGDEELIEDVQAHVERHIGKIANVYHELISDLVHIDVFMVEPTEEQPFYTLVTCGMSALPMTVPEGCEEYRFAELVICLPSDWPMTDEAWDDENNYWPIRWLKQLARYPHECNTWFAWGHTIPTGNPPEPISDNTLQCGFLFLPPVNFSEEFFEVTRANGEVINFWGLYPLYEEEMDFKLNEGADALLDRFEQFDVDCIVNPQRLNCCEN